MVHRCMQNMTMARFKVLCRQKSTCNSSWILTKSQGKGMVQLIGNEEDLKVKIEEGLFSLDNGLHAFAALRNCGTRVH